MARSRYADFCRADSWPRSFVLTYPIPASNTRFELLVKKSRFIAITGFCSDQTQVRHFIAAARLEFPDAGHICHACIIGAPGSGSGGCSDDGEPSGTAGKPILNVLQHSGLGDIITVVVRYFGGIKLGAGGLVRAYSNSASGSLGDLQTTFAETLVALQFTIDFALENEARRVLGNTDAREISPDYSHQLTISCKIPSLLLDTAIDQLTSLSRGQITFVDNPADLK